MLVIVLVLLGHHSFQASAIEIPNHHKEEVSCSDHDCHHETSMEICEQFQSDKIQISLDSYVVGEISGCPPLTTYKGDNYSEEIFKRNHERIPISHSQFARSHLA